jgi:CDP-diacylglycerol--glycerol-3-phosphate 3-phosphatidyltransferase
VLRETEGRLLAFIILVILALVSSQMVSYLRARGEGLGIETKVGFVTRPERVVLLSLGVFLGGLGVDLAVEAALGAIAGLSTFTLFQRLFHVWRSLEKK